VDEKQRAQLSRIPISACLWRIVITGHNPWHFQVLLLLGEVRSGYLLPSSHRDARSAPCPPMRSVVTESGLVKQQLLILNGSRARSPNLRTSDRLVAGLCVLLMRPARLIRSAIVLKPSTLLSLHQGLRNRKYRLLFSSKRRRKPGPKGPSKELIKAVVHFGVDLRTLHDSFG
jgi:hypothetical protein